MKGILIFFVVLLHLPWVATMLCGYDCSLFEWSKHNTQFIGVYYMVAFFFVTGFCTNFDKAAKPFVLSNAKTLLVPAVVFSILDMLRQRNFDFIGLFFYEGAFWFLPALFWAKIIYYFLRKYLSQGKPLLLMVICLCALGFSLHDYDVKNFWAIEHGMAFLPAIGLGEYIKHREKKIYEYISILIFILGYVICCLFEIKVPVLARTFKPVLSQMPLFLLLSCSGSLMILFVSKYISCHSILFKKSLVFWGQNSLLIYLVSNTIMEYLFKMVGMIVPWLYAYRQSFMFNLSVYFIIVILTMYSFYPLVKFFNIKGVKWTLGKF